MFINTLLNEMYIVLVILLAINLWMVIGFAIILGFSDFKEEMEYKDVILMCFTFPLVIMLIISKHLHTKEIKNGK